MVMVLSFYKIVTYLLSNISSPRSVCCEAATDKNFGHREENDNLLILYFQVKEETAVKCFVI